MCFENVSKNFGFGLMRLPMIGDQVDFEQTKKMVDLFLEKGFTYFDTAHGYLDGKSEIAVKECISSRYPRDKYILTNKLSGHYFSDTDGIRPLFESQLEACGVEYFDFYLMHAMSKSRFERYCELKAVEVCQQLKAEGKIRHIGMSFHDTADVLDEILTAWLAIEVVQLQFNYLDYESERVQSRKCYEVCQKHGKPVLVMEPVKGGSLVNLPVAAQKVLDDLQGGSYASYAIRFAAGFENVKMVLSGMSNLEQMMDNLSFMEQFQPLNDAEHLAVEKVASILRTQDLIACTGCRYCTEECPQAIPIPELFAAENAKKLEDAVPEVPTGSTSSDCLECGLCEKICPQNLKIRDLLKKIATEA